MALRSLADQSGDDVKRAAVISLLYHTGDSSDMKERRVSVTSIISVFRA